MKVRKIQKQTLEIIIAAVFGGLIGKAIDILSTEFDNIKRITIFFVTIIVISIILYFLLGQISKK
ncbi:hypothetical protein HY450_03365 [Candidatus Pacearchaeota archaeon]|nr:hypothetical protein [Candidatus Pacearchaeota archaeon]